MNDSSALFSSGESASYRVDSFSVPEASRVEFDAQLRRSLAVIEKLPGFRGKLVLEKTGGPTHFNLVTLAIWESAEAQAAAAVEAQAHYKRMGWDIPALLARWGVVAELGSFGAVSGLTRVVP